jgi:hypothetical protein
MHDYATKFIVAFIGVKLLIVDDDVANINVFDAKVEELMVHMKLQVLEFFKNNLSFLDQFEKKRGHNMLALMLDSKFKRSIISD